MRRQQTTPERGSVTHASPSTLFETGIHGTQVVYKFIAYIGAWKMTQWMKDLPCKCKDPSSGARIQAGHGVMHVCNPRAPVMRWEGGDRRISRSLQATSPGLCSLKEQEGKLRQTLKFSSALHTNAVACTYLHSHTQSHTFM